MSNRLSSSSCSFQYFLVLGDGALPMNVPYGVSGVLIPWRTKGVDGPSPSFPEEDSLFLFLPPRGLPWDWDWVSAHRLAPRFDGEPSSSSSAAERLSGRGRSFSMSSPPGVSRLASEIRPAAADAALDPGLGVGLALGRPTQISRLKSTTL